MRTKPAKHLSEHRLSESWREVSQVEVCCCWIPTNISQHVREPAAWDVLQTHHRVPSRSHAWSSRLQACALIPLLLDRLQLLLEDLQVGFLLLHLVLLPRFGRLHRQGLSLPPRPWLCWPSQGHWRSTCWSACTGCPSLRHS